MKRDWDLLREQLLAIEEDKDFKASILGEIPVEPKWENYKEWADFESDMAKYQTIEARICGHMEMLVNNGYVDGVVISRSNSGFSYSLARPRLTMAGHELLDTIRSKPLWEKIKSTAKDRGVELTLDSIKGLAALALKSLIGS